MKVTIEIDLTIDGNWQDTDIDKLETIILESIPSGWTVEDDRLIVYAEQSSIVINRD